MPKNIKNRQYNIHDKLSDLPVKNLQVLRRNPLKYLGIPRSTFTKDCVATIDRPRDIPVKRMAAYAAFFKCSIEDLVNQKLLKKINKRFESTLF